MTDEKLISIIVPVYDEEKCVEEVSDRQALVFDLDKTFCFKIIINKNGLYV